MKNMKKIIAVLLVLAALASLFTACLQFVFFYQFLFSDSKSKGQFTGFHLFIQVQVDEQIVITFQLYGAAE